MVIGGPTLNVTFGAKSSNSISPLGASSPRSESRCNISAGSRLHALSSVSCLHRASVMPIAEMSRESRHVHVVGLPDALSEDRVSNFFSTFGRVQKAERLSSSGVVVSFMDVRSAQKAHSAEPKFDGHQLRISFHEQSKNGIVSSSVPSGGVVSPQGSKSAPSGAAAGDCHRRSSELHSPGSASSKHKDRSSQHRMPSSASSRRASRERCTNSRTDERLQRSRNSINSDRRNGGESRNSRRSRRSPRSSDSSDSSRDSPSPSGGPSHHHHSNTPSVPSTVVKLSSSSASSSRRVDPLDSCQLSHDSANVSLGSPCAQPSPVQGMQGVYVTNLPSSRSESSLREFLGNAFKKFGKIIHIGFETELAPNFVEQRKALIIFQRLNEVDRLLNDVHHLLGLRLKIKLASHVLVSDTYNNLLALTSAQASALSGTALTPSSSSHDTPSAYSRSFIKEGSSTSSLHCSPCVDALAPRASRTLYVGGLERRTSDDSLRSRFAHFGHILDIDVKNWESPSPFAFIQFADIQSVVRAINAYNGGSGSSHTSSSKGKFKTNWGRTIVTNKIWIGELPSSCSADYVREKIRVSFTETFNEVIYDPRWNEALLLFATNDSAQRAFSMIKTKQIAFWDGDEKRDAHVPVDYCSEKLHDYFVDRKFGGDKESAAGDVNGTSAFGSSSTSTAVASTSSLLAPPPDPPSHLRDVSSYRVDYRRSGSNGMSKRRRSNERESSRNCNRSSRYSCVYSRSRRRRELARRDDDQSASTSTSTSSSSDSDSSDSRAASPERKREDTRSRSSQRTTATHPSSNCRKAREQSASSSSCPRRGSATPTMKAGVTVDSGTTATVSGSTVNTTTTTATTNGPQTSGATTTSNSGGGGSHLAQLLPPPMPSAAILNPLVAPSSSSSASAVSGSGTDHHHRDRTHAQTSRDETSTSCVQTATTSSSSTVVADVKEKRSSSLASKRRRSYSSSSADDGDNPATVRTAVVERRHKDRHTASETNTGENRNSRDSGFCESTQDNSSTIESHVITSNRIEEIANTLVNVIQHHSKASTSTVPIDALAMTQHRTSSIHAAASSSLQQQQRSSTDDPKTAQWASNGSSAQSTAATTGQNATTPTTSTVVLQKQRARWPWGNEPVKSHSTIPLEQLGHGTPALRDPRRRSGTGSTKATTSNLPLPKFAYDVSVGSSRRNSLTSEASRATQSHTEARRLSRGNVNGGHSSACTPPHSNTTPQRAHPSVSRSASSGSDAMLSPDPTTTTSQQAALSTPGVDIFGEGSPSSDSNAALRERIFALGAKFQHVDETFQKTKRTSQLDYERKPITQRPYKFEEELERLRAKSSTCSPSTPMTSATVTSASNSANNPFTDSFLKMRSYSVPSAGGASAPHATPVSEAVADDGGQKSTTSQQHQQQTTCSSLAGVCGSTAGLTTTPSASVQVVTACGVGVCATSAISLPPPPPLNTSCGGGGGPANVAVTQSTLALGTAPPVLLSAASFQTTPMSSSSTAATLTGGSTVASASGSIPVNCISPQFASTPLKRPPMPPSPAVLKSQQHQTVTSVTQLVTAPMPPHVVAFPPNFSVPPPPIPMPPALPPSILPPSTVLPASALITAPPPPPPMMPSAALHRDSVSSSGGASCSSSQQTSTNLSQPPKGSGTNMPNVASTPIVAFQSTPQPMWKSPSTNSNQKLSTASNPQIPSETTIKSASSTPKSSITRPVDKMMSRDLQRSSSWASVPKQSHGERSKHAEASAKCISGLFRQQAQDSSEMRKKQMQKDSADQKQDREKEGESARKTANDSFNSERSTVAKDGDRKEKQNREGNRERKRGWDGSDKARNDAHHASEKKDRERDRDKEGRNRESGKERKTSKEEREKDKERSKAKERAKEKVAKARKEEERKRRELKEKERKRAKEKAKEKKARKRVKDSDEESGSGDSESSSSDEQINIHSFDIEMQRLMLEEAASGSLGLSMYDRVKRRSSALKPDETAKKNKTLEILREKAQRKQGSQKRVKRVQLDSSSDDGEEDDESDALSSESSDALHHQQRSLKSSSKGRKSQKSARKQELSDESLTDEDEVAKSTEESATDEDTAESRNRKKRSASGKKTWKGSKNKSKTHSLSLDDVFGAYSTEDESTQQSRGSLAPSVDSKGDSKEKKAKEKEKARERDAEKEREKERADKQRNREREKAKEKEREKEREEKEREKEKEEKEREREREMERSDETEREKEKEKEREKKSEPKKRTKKTLSTIELFGRDSDIEMPTERKKQKMEKSLVEISMFPETVRKVGRPRKTKETPRRASEVKKVDESKEKHDRFERKLARRLRKEQKEREEELRRTTEDESKKKELEEEAEKDADKLNEVEESTPRKGTAVVRDVEEKSPVKDEPMVVVKTEVEDEHDNDEVVVEQKPANMDTNTSDTQTAVTEDVIDRKRKVLDETEETPLNVKRIKEVVEETRPRKWLSDSESSTGDMKQKGVRKKKGGKRRAPRKRTNNDRKSSVTEARSDSSVTPVVKSEQSEESERVLTPCDDMGSQKQSVVVDEGRPVSKDKTSSLLEDASKWGAESTKSATDEDDITSVCGVRVMSKGAMKALPPHQNQSNHTSPNNTTKHSNEGSELSTDDEHEPPEQQQHVLLASSPTLTRQRFTSSSSSSSTSATTTSHSGSSTTAEQEHEHRVAVESSTMAAQPVSAVERQQEPSGARTSCDAQTAIDTVKGVSGGKNDGSQPEQEAQSAAATRSLGDEENKQKATDGLASVSLRAQDMIAFVPSLDAHYAASSMLVSTAAITTTPSEEFGDSNGGFELIDSGRVDDLMEEGAEEEQQQPHTPSPPPERDVHDVQETEDAVQSIALFDDSASRHSGDDGSAAIELNYMSDTTSRRSSLAEVHAPQPDNSDAHSKPFVATVEQQEEGKGLDAESEKKTDDETSSLAEKVVLGDGVTHIDEVIDDVVAGGYMEVDAEQLMLINSKAKEADRAAAFASQQNTPQTPHSTQSSFHAESSINTPVSARSVELQQQQPPLQQTPSSCMVQSQLLQKQQHQVQVPPQQQQNQRIVGVASPYRHPQLQQQQPLGMQQTHHDMLEQQPTMGLNGGASDLHQLVGIQLQPQQTAPPQQQQTSAQQPQIQHANPRIQPLVQALHQKAAALSSAHMMQPQQNPMQLLMHQPLPVRQQLHLLHEGKQQHAAVHMQQQQHTLFGEQQPPVEQPIQASAPLTAAPQQQHGEQQQQVQQQRPNALSYGSCSSDYFTSSLASGTQPAPDAGTAVAQSRALQQQQPAPLNVYQQQQLGYGEVQQSASSRVQLQHQQTAANAVQQRTVVQQQPQQVPQQQHQTSFAHDIYRQIQTVKQPSQQAPLAHQHDQEQQQVPAQPLRQETPEVGRQMASGNKSTSSPVMLSHLPSDVSTIPMTAVQQQTTTCTSTTTNSTAYRRQQASPLQQAAIAASAALSPFAMPLPATSSSTYFQTAQMQEQYMQMCRNTLLQQGSASASTTPQPQDATAAVMRNYALLQATYGSGMPGTYGAPPHAAYPTSTSLVNGSSSAPPLTAGMQQDRVRQPQPNAGIQHAALSTQQPQQQSCGMSSQQQQANMAAVAQHQLNSLYTNGGIAFGYGGSPMQQQQQQQPQLKARQAPLQVVPTGDVSLSGVKQRTPVQVTAPTANIKKQQQIKTFPQPPSVASSSRYPVLWQGIVALKTNEARIQMHRVGGNFDMLKRSLKQLATMSNNMPVIRINQRMRMETSQLESVQSKMTDEQSYIALICLSCGFNKDDIRNQSEMLKERFVDYLESKQAAGICNVGNEQHPSPNSIVHVFPPCEFATSFLQRNSPDLFETIRQQRANYLFVVITTAS